MSAAAHDPGRWLLRGLMWAIMACFASAATFGIVMLLVGDASDSSVNMLGTSLVAGAYLGVGLAAATLQRRGILPRLMGISIVLSLAAAATWTIMIWYERQLDWRMEQLFVRVGFTLTIGCLALVYSGGLCSLPARSGTLNGLRWAIVALAWTFAAVLLLLLWLGERIDRTLPSYVLVGLVGVASITGVLALLGPIVLRTLMVSHAKRFAKEARAMSSSIRVTLGCPRCEQELTVRTGPARCRACGFTMTVEVEEPRCECGYLLYQLVGDTCPECGRTIPDSERWADAGA